MVASKVVKKEMNKRGGVSRSQHRQTVLRIGMWERMSWKTGGDSHYLELENGESLQSWVLTGSVYDHWGHSRTPGTLRVSEAIWR